MNGSELIQWARSLDEASSILRKLERKRVREQFHEDMAVNALIRELTYDVAEEPK